MSIIDEIKRVDEELRREQKETGEVSEPKVLVSSTTGEKVKTRGVVHRDFSRPSNPKYERNSVDYSKVEMTNGDHIIYGIDEIGSILGLYGKDSEIYNAMAEGKVVSPMVEKSMKKNKEIGNEEIAKREESLLARCLKREKEQGLGV